MKNSLVILKVNCLDPGTVNTKMLLISLGPIGIEVEDANDLFFLVTNPSVARTTGKYFVSQKISQAPVVCTRHIAVS